MPLISTIGRKSLSVRLLIGAIYTVLAIGGVTMVYPLLLMISGSVKGKLDADQIDVVPRFLRDDRVFFQRYVESKYNESLAALNDAWGTDLLRFDRVKPPAPVSPRLLDDFDEFRRTAPLPLIWKGLGHCAPPGRNLRAFRREIQREAGGDLARASEILDATLTSWAEVGPRGFGGGRSLLTPTKAIERSEQFKEHCRVEDLFLGNAEGNWKSTTLQQRYGRKIEKYRQTTGLNLASWEDVHLTAHVPATTNAAVRADWEDYARQKVGLAALRVDASAAPAFHDYLRKVYDGNLKRLNLSYGTRYASFDEVSVSAQQTFTGSAFADFNRFIRDHAPAEALSIDGPLFRYREFLRTKFHNDIAAARAVYGIGWQNFDEASLPTAAMDWRDFQKLKSELRREFLVRNYDYVLDFLARHGRAFQNTFILVVLFLVTHLTVNPLAAYALSRFGLPTTYKILLFCMATVAFPGEVMMIPTFLQLKQLGLLNTFAALVLPGLAHGYSIFLLKGFFDSLPKELYESATIDGAGEWTTFWTITMSLSKPILAVMALGSFTGAFGAFFYALIICPDQKMWTLMVWLYELQSMTGSQSLNFAALCLASIPTLLVFIFCQRIILRGIVVPTEK